MGEKACPETINPTSFGGTADWFGAGYGAVDLSGEEYSHKGNNSTVISNTASVNYNENNSSGNNMTSSSYESNNGVLNAKSVDSNEKPKLRIRMFKRKQRGKGKPVYFSGFEVDRHINGSTFFVKEQKLSLPKLINIT